MIVIVLLALVVTFAFLFVVVWTYFFNIDEKMLARMTEVCKKALELGHYRKAKNILWFLSRKDKNIEIKYQLGLSQLALKEYKKARDTFEAILRVEKMHAKSLTRLAEIECIEKHYEKALECYICSIKLNARNVENFIGIADIYFVNRDFSKALEVYQKALELEPENDKIKLSILKCKAELCEVGGEIDCKSVIEEYTQSQEIEDVPEFNKEIAKVYAKSGDIRTAQEYCEKMLSYKKNDVETLQMLGLLMLLKQDFEAAKSYLTQAFSADPRNPETHNILSYVISQQVDNTPVRVSRMEYYNLVKEYLNGEKDNNS